MKRGEWLPTVKLVCLNEKGGKKKKNSGGKKGESAGWLKVDANAFPSSPPIRIN